MHIRLNTVPPNAIPGPVHLEGTLRECTTVVTPDGGSGNPTSRLHPLFPERMCRGIKTEVQVSRQEELDEKKRQPAIKTGNHQVRKIGRKLMKKRPEASLGQEKHHKVTNGCPSVRP